MHAICFTNIFKPDRAKEGYSLWKEKILPLAKKTPGYLGDLVLVDDNNPDRVREVMLWESKHHFEKFYYSPTMIEIKKMFEDFYREPEQMENFWIAIWDRRSPTAWIL